MKCYLKTVAACGVLCLTLVVLLIPARNASGAWQGRTLNRVRKVDELFNKNCARCHGADGRGDTPGGHLFKAPDFTDPKWWQENPHTTAGMRSVVMRGKAGMPGFGKKLTRTEIYLLVNRVRSFRKLERKS